MLASLCPAPGPLPLPVCWVRAAPAMEWPLLRETPPQLRHCPAWHWAQRWSWGRTPQPTLALIPSLSSFYGPTTLTASPHPLLKPILWNCSSPVTRDLRIVRSNERIFLNLSYCSASENFSLKDSWRQKRNIVSPRECGLLTRSHRHEIIWSFFLS